MFPEATQNNYCTACFTNCMSNKPALLIILAALEQCCRRPKKSKTTLRCGSIKGYSVPPNKSCRGQEPKPLILWGGRSFTKSRLVSCRQMRKETSTNMRMSTPQSQTVLVMHKIFGDTHFCSTDLTSADSRSQGGWNWSLGCGARFRKGTGTPSARRTLCFPHIWLTVAFLRPNEPSSQCSSGSDKRNGRLGCPGVWGSVPPGCPRPAMCVHGQPTARGPCAGGSRGGGGGGGALLWSRLGRRLLAPAADAAAGLRGGGGDSVRGVRRRRGCGGPGAGNGGQATGAWWLGVAWPRTPPASRVGLRPRVARVCSSELQSRETNCGRLRAPSWPAFLPQDAGADVQVGQGVTPAPGNPPHMKFHRGPDGHKIYDTTHVWHRPMTPEPPEYDS